ncbi:uncharacterized protein LOC143377894 isoform X1 [Andrena cerasifolii]|uniref:uncharacterized protein LOC143377894 isoform X1 n=1 Tax=Andrena cerasifolii TaxID=2819439 RepID=UPI0040382370
MAADHHLHAMPSEANLCNAFMQDKAKVDMQRPAAGYARDKYSRVMPGWSRGFSAVPLEGCELRDAEERGDGRKHAAPRPSTGTVDHRLTAGDVHAPPFFIFIRPAVEIGALCRSLGFFVDQAALSACFASRHFAF